MPTAQETLLAALRLATEAAATLGTPSAAPSGLDLGVTAAGLSVASFTPPDTRIDTFKAIGLGDVPTFEVQSPSGEFRGLGASLLVGAVELDHTIASTTEVRVRGVAQDQRSEVVRTLPVQVVKPSGPTAPIYDLNFVTGVYSDPADFADITVVQPKTSTALTSDGSPKSFAAHTKRITDLGWSISATPAEWLGLNSQKPTAWDDNDNPAWASWKRVNLVAVGGFSPIRISAANQGSTGVFTALSRTDLPISAPIILKLRCKDGPGAGGFALKYRDAQDSRSLHALAYCNAPMDPSPKVVLQDGDTTLIGVTTNPDGTRDFIFRTKVKIASMQPGVSAAADDPSKTLDVYGLQTTLGAEDLPWSPTGSTGIVQPADDARLGPRARVPFTNVGGGTFMLELDGAIWSTLNGEALLSAGTRELLGARYVQVEGAAGQVLAAAGLGGMLGISRVVLVIAPRNAGYTLYLNGGEGVTSTTALPQDTVMRLCAGINGRIRRIKGWAYPMTSGEARRESEIVNRTLLRAGAALNPGAVRELFVDEFNNNSLRALDLDRAKASALSPADGSTFRAADFTDHVGYYESARAGKAWIDTYVFANYPQGVVSPINGELQLYPRKEYPWKNGYAGAVRIEGGCMTLTCQRPEAIGAEFAAQMPINPVTSRPFEYVSGVASTAGAFEYRFGYREWDAEVPGDVPGLWGAFWGLSGAEGGYASHTEIDDYEVIGAKPFCHTGAVHGENYGWNAGPYLPAYEHPLPYRIAGPGAGRHTFGLDWRPGFLDWYIDGRKIAGMSTAGHNIDQYKQYLLVNLAVSGSGGFGAADERTLAAMPQALRLHRVRVVQPLRYGG